MIAINMEMPKSCNECGLKDGSYCYFKKPPYNFNGFNVLKSRHKDCPLVEIVTCKDCKYNKNGICPNYRHFVDDDFYCGDAIRKE